MGISLSQGPWSYNRFDLYEKKAKPDFLDMDKDGDKKESMKKAIKEKGDCGCGKKPCDCDKNEEFEGGELIEGTPALKSGKYGTPPSGGSAKTPSGLGNSTSNAAKRGTVPTSLTSGKYGTPVSSPPSVKESKSYVPGAKVGVKVKKGPGLKEEICEILMDEGFVNNVVSAEVMFNHMSEEWLEELYKGKHGQSEKEYMDGRSDAGKQISGDSKQSGAAYSHRAFKGAGGPAKPGERQKAQGKMTQADRDELAIRKNALKANK